MPNVATEAQPRSGGRILSLLPGRLLPELPRLELEEAMQALNGGLQIAPETEQLLGALAELHPRAKLGRRAVVTRLHDLCRGESHLRRRAEQREIAEQLGVPRVTVARVVADLRQLGLLQTAGGEFDPDRGVRACLDYRLRFSPAVALQPHQWLMARLWTWAVTAGVKQLAEVRRLILLGRWAELELLVVARRMLDAREQRETPQPAPVPDPEPVRREAPRGHGPVLLGDVLKARLAKVEQGVLNSNPAPAEAKVEQGPGRDNPQRGVTPRNARKRARSGRAHAPITPSKIDALDEASQTVGWYAEALGDNSPRSTVRHVLGEGTRRGLSADAVVGAWQRAAAETVADLRERRAVGAGYIRRPAAVAVRRFHLELDRMVRQEVA